MPRKPMHPRHVHLPLGLGVATPLAAIGVVGVEALGGEYPEAWAVVLGLQGLLVVSAALALRTGELAAPAARSLVPRSALSGHRLASRAFAAASLGTFLVMLAGALAPCETGASARLVSVVCGCLGLALAVRAGNTGGALVFTHGAADAYHADPGL